MRVRIEALLDAPGDEIWKVSEHQWEDDHDGEGYSMVQRRRWQVVGIVRRTPEGWEARRRREAIPPTDADYPCGMLIDSERWIYVHTGGSLREAIDFVRLTKIVRMDEDEVAA